MKKSCHEASETSSCVRGRPQACERSVSGYERQRRAHGHDVPLTCAPHGGQPGRAVGVEEVALVLSPAVSATPRPPAAGSRRLRRCATLLTRSVSSSRATPSQPCRRLRFVEICGALQVFGMIVHQVDYTHTRVTLTLVLLQILVFGAFNGRLCARDGKRRFIRLEHGLLTVTWPSGSF